MDENLSRGYVSLGKRGNVLTPLATPPTDRLGLVYVVMLLMGAGFLFPYNRYNTGMRIDNAGLGHTRQLYILGE